MKQTDARALFPNHKLTFSTADSLKENGEKYVAVHHKETGELVATINQHQHKVVVCLVRKPKRKSDVPHYVAFAEVASYANVDAVQKALDAERLFDGKGPATYLQARAQFTKTQEQDFDFGIDLLAIFIGVTEKRHSGFTRGQMPYLTTRGKQMYRVACTCPDMLNLPPIQKAPVTSPVTQLAKTLHEGKTKRTARDQRTVWDAEDDAAKSSMMFDHMTRFVAGDNDRVTWNEEDDKVFAMVEHDHKLLSDRLAALHSARGSKISIPEFDRRRKAQQEKQNG